MSEKKVIKVQDILTDLENGMTRKEIKEKYNLSGKDLKTVFQHEKLKNKKTKTTGVILIDEDEQETTTIEPETQPEVELSEELPEQFS